MSTPATVTRGNSLRVLRALSRFVDLCIVLASAIGGAKLALHLDNTGGEIFLATVAGANAVACWLMYRFATLWRMS